MSFRENLLQKIRADRLAAQVGESLAASEGSAKTDLKAMAKLLDMSAYQHKRVRDLDLYIHPVQEGLPEIVILEKGLPLYRARPEDVALRKSPTLRETLSIRNAIKILNDADVLVCRAEKTLERVHQDILRGLDLRFHTADIESLREKGILSFKLNEPEGVRENLTLFAELLGWRSLSGLPSSPEATVFGREIRDAEGGPRYGPAVIYRSEENDLGYWGESLPAQAVTDWIAGKSKPESGIFAHGEAVFGELQRLVRETAGL